MDQVLSEQMMQSGHAVGMGAGVPRRRLAAACAAACLLAMTCSAAAAPAAARRASQNARSAKRGASREQQQTTPAETSKSASRTAKQSKKNTTNLTKVTVTGIRGAIENSLKIKQDSDDIVEAISAEDIGKLPDASIAGSLSRLPGLATQRGVNGMANRISIRGLAPNFTGTLLNGHRQATTGENRGVEFNQYPAELINGVTVYKTPDAALVGQGLSGTIDLHTIKPLDFDTPRVVANVRGQRTSNGTLNPGSGVGDTGHRISLSYIDQYVDHTLGLAVGFANLDTPVQEKKYQAWYWSIDNGPAGIANSPTSFPARTPGVPDNVISQQGMQLRAQSEDQVRNGVMAVLEWAPNSTYYSTLNLFYSNFDKRRHKNGLQWSSSPYDQYADPPYDDLSYTDVGVTPGQPYPTLTSGTMHGISPIMQNQYTKERDYLFSADWNNTVYFADGWTAKADASYSNARVKLHDAYAFTGLRSGLLDVKFRTSVGPAYPHFNPLADLTDPANIVFTDPDAYSYDGRDEFDRQKDDIKALRLSVSHPLGWIFDSVDLGVDYSDRTKSKHADVFFAYLNGNGTTPETYDPTFKAAIDPGLLRAPTSLAYGGVPGIVDYNVLRALGSQFTLVEKNGAGDYNRNYTVEEKVPLAYAKFNIRTHVGAVGLRGNVGVQFVHTNQSSQAFQTTGDARVGKLTGGSSYNEVLPSLNLVADLGHRQYLRFGIAKELARGRIDDEKVASSASVSKVLSGPGAGQVLWHGSGGNPALKPYIAVGSDLAYEWYFGKVSHVGIDVFNKNILNYIYTQTTLDHDFSGYVNNNPLLTPTSNIGSFSRPVNGTGGKMQGVELQGALGGEQISPALTGFGVQGNFSITNSSIPDSTISKIPGGPKTLPGLSRKVANLALYYENHGFSLRVAERYRSSYTGEAVALFDQIGYTKILSNKETDLQASYTFPGDSRLKGLELLLQVSNLTNEPFKTQSVAGLPNGVKVGTPLEYDTWGRTVLFGARYKL